MRRGHKQFGIFCFCERAEVLGFAFEEETAVQQRLQRPLLSGRAAAAGLAAGFDPAQLLIQGLAEAAFLDAGDLFFAIHAEPKHHTRERTAETALFIDGISSQPCRLDLSLFLLRRDEDHLERLVKGSRVQWSICATSASELDREKVLSWGERDVQLEHSIFRRGRQGENVHDAQASVLISQGHVQAGEGLVDIRRASRATCEALDDSVKGFIHDARDLRKISDSLGELADNRSLGGRADGLDSVGHFADFLDENAEVRAAVEGIDAQEGIARHWQVLL